MGSPGITRDEQSKNSPYALETKSSNVTNPNKVVNSSRLFLSSYPSVYSCQYLYICLQVAFVPLQADRWVGRELSRQK